jgi:transposase
MPQPNDLSRSLVALDQDSTIIAVVEMSQSSWLVGGVLPGIERQPRKQLEKRFSALWKVTRSTRPAKTSVAALVLTGCIIVVG